MKMNSNIIFINLIFFAIFIASYLSFTYYHDDFIFLYEGLINYKNINSIFDLNIFFKDRFLHDILMIGHFKIIGDNLLIFNFVKILYIIILTFLLKIFLSISIPNFKYKNNIIYIYILSPFLLGTTFWQTNLAWLLILIIHFLTLIIIIKKPNFKILIIILIINHILSINLQLLIFNFFLVFLFFGNTKFKINKNKFYSISILNIIQIFFSLLIILKTTEKSLIDVNSHFFLVFAKSAFNNFLLISYDLLKIYNFFIVFIFFIILFSKKKNLFKIDKLYFFPIVGIFLNLIIFTYANYNFRLQGIESRVALLVSIYIHFIVIILFKNIKDDKKIIFFYIFSFFYLYGYLNHYSTFNNFTKNQNLLIKKLNSLGPDESTKTPINVEHTTFDRPDKIKKFLFIKTQDYKWLNAKIEITKQSNEYKIIKKKIINFIFN